MDKYKKTKSIKLRLALSFILCLSFFLYCDDGLQDLLEDDFEHIAYIINAGKAQWMNTNWKYRRPIHVTNNTADLLTDFQVAVELTSANFDYTHSENNGDDIRFTSNSGTFEIPFWIEEYIYSGNSKIWVKLPGIPASSVTTIYIYYGNTSVSSTSSGTNTFEFFDDFEDGDISDWTQQVGAGGSVTNTLAKHGSWSITQTPTAIGFPECYKSITINENRYIEFWWRFPQTNANCYATTEEIGGTWLDSVNPYANATGNWAYDDGAPNVLPDLYSANTWYHHKILIKPGSPDSTFDWWIDGDKKVTDGTTTGDPENFSAFSITLNNGSTHYLDSIFMRKYASPEPGISIGEEEIR